MERISDIPVTNVIARRRGEQGSYPFGHTVMGKSRFPAGPIVHERRPEGQNLRECSLNAPSSPAMFPNGTESPGTGKGGTESKGQSETLPVCPLCKGSGYVRSDVPFGHPSFGKAVPCQCKKARINEARRKLLWDLSGLDHLPAFRDACFENFDTYLPGVQEGYHAAFAFAQQPQGWLVLAGKNGCGKTHLAVAIARQCMAQGFTVRFAIIPELLADLRVTFSPESKTTYNEAFEQLCQAELLVLDDFGAHYDTRWAESELFRLLNNRYNAHLSTVITTNKIDFVGVEDRIRSRLRDCRLVRTITFIDTIDYRAISHGLYE
jgi:DNA replication protein DnaC